MNDQRLAWEDHELDVEQLELLAPESTSCFPTSPEEPKKEEASARVYQLTELPGETWEDIFGGAA